MKIAALLASLLVISFVLAYADSEIPFSTKQKAIQLYEKNNITEKSVTQILSDLSKHNLVKIPYSVHHIQTVSEFGQTGFVKLSGRIAEFGKTAQISLEITKPDGTIEDLRVPLVETGRWSTSYPIDWTSQSGTYRVVAEFGEAKSITYFHLTNTPIPESNIPPWLLTTFEWWIQDKITDLELIYAIQHLSNLGLVIISEKSTSQLQVKITGEELVRRGTTHTINVHVSDGTNPIQGAKVTLVIEDYGEDIIREFDGFTNQNGYFVFSWEIPKSFDDYETLLAYISISGNGSSQTQLFKFTVYCYPGEDNCKVEGN
ncbi:MAG: hypothetical protein GTN35_01975 [Nitrososphaeria archaeon]|nr:hypothetical protein [Nitrosopumilaceae archaeon]NIP09289.1 hypothetical protein [Nitrosopumilaceae archaeon]NIP91163.1 hypothetical protein [Nitrososphaeria archaeon]NIS94457.1 hypothetical protein [Nitrosopumilaceae archaeon]